MGKSGSGKSTLLQALKKDEQIADKVNFIITDTTRERREDEPIVAYNFISGADFADRFLNNEYLEACAFNGNFYGTRYNAFEHDKVNIGIWTPSGFLNIKDSLSKDSIIYPVYLEVSDVTRWKRLLSRVDSKDEDIIDKLYQRHKEDNTEFTETQDQILYFYWPNESSEEFTQNLEMMKHLVIILDNYINTLD